MSARPRLRRLGARLLCACVLGAQLYLVVAAYRDPLKRFGFQPFAESSVWSARLVRVDARGVRRDLHDGSWEYRWDALVRERGLGSPARVRHAKSGVKTTLYFLQHALDYVADHTPEDRSTRYLQAEVSYRRNRGPTQHAVLRSKLRDVP
jgi:hypothetical protein